MSLRGREEKQLEAWLVKELAAAGAVCCRGVNSGGWSASMGWRPVVDETRQLGEVVRTWGEVEMSLSISRMGKERKAENEAARVKAEWV